MEAVWDRKVRDGGYGQSRPRKGRSWREEVLDLADLLVNFGKGAPDFLVRVTGIGEGVLHHQDSAELQTIITMVIFDTISA